MSQLKTKSTGVTATEQAAELETQFRACYEANYRSLRRYIARLSGEAEEAGDLTQESFVRLWKELESGTQLINPRAWLYRVAGNLVINRFKGRAHERAHESQAPLRLAPDDVERTLIRRQLVQRALQQLPAPMRQGLLLYHEGLTGREIAVVLGVKPSYVGTLIMRAHERFRRECEAVGGGHDLLR